ncbi:MAG: DUF4292 domain-containing protein [Bacteroidetes bacterium]|nr:DUF4292 domain-containing protein [Bacteroidota bacterium]
MFKHIKYFLPVILSVYFISCTSSEKLSDSSVSFDLIKEKVNENSRKLNGLDAYGEISIDSPEISNTGSITVSIKKPDSVFTKLEGPFGIDIANILITRNDFIYYNVMDNKVIKGPSTPRNLSIIMRIKIDFDDIVNSFSGKYFFPDGDYAGTEINETENEYLVTINNKSENEIRKFWIDKDNFFVRKTGKYSADGKTKLEITYENFYESKGIYFPKKISVIRPEERQSIWLTYNNEEFNNGKLNYRIKIPKSAKQISWQ